MRSSVLDASAVLALLNEEPGADMVAKSIDNGAVMCSVNLSEVIAKLIEHGLNEHEISEVFTPLSVESVPFDDELAWRAGSLRGETRQYGLSLGDRACLATGAWLKLPVLTADRAWKGISINVEIRLIRGD